MSHTEALGAHHSILPKLDKEEVSAVRSFLPGKLLSRTTTVLSTLLPVTLAFLHALGVFHGIVLPDLEIWRDHPWLTFLILCGFSILAVVVQVFVERHAKWVQRTLQALAMRSGAEQSGYFRIGPYVNTAEDRIRFNRADRAHEKVLMWLQRSARVPLYLTGDSGSGKSSLLSAFVLPTLRERGWTVVETRAWQDPEGALRDALARLLRARRHQPPENPDLRSFIEAAARPNARLLLVLDQFEEFVMLGKQPEQQAFSMLVADLQSKPIKGVSVLLVLRSDYQIFLEDIGLPLLQYNENLFQVGRFTHAAATDFLARSGLELQPKAIDVLLASAAELDETPGLVRPITLNVIGYVLATGKAVVPSVDAGQLVRLYIEQTVRQPAIRDFAPPILEQLVTEQGTKRPRSEQELAVSTRLRRGEVRAVLNGLGSAALARPLDAAQGVWELSHDFIARAVLRYLGRRPRDLVWRAAAYTAPVLFGAMLLTVGGAFAWNRVHSFPWSSPTAGADAWSTMKTVQDWHFISNPTLVKAPSLGSPIVLNEPQARHLQVSFPYDKVVHDRLQERGAIRASDGTTLGAWMVESDQRWSLHHLENGGQFELTAWNILGNWNWNMLRNWREEAKNQLPKPHLRAVEPFNYYADVVVANGSRNCAVAYAAADPVGQDYHQDLRGILCGTGAPETLQATLAKLLSDAYKPSQTLAK
jgi:hypothetical protein